MTHDDKMGKQGKQGKQVEALLATPDLADALESEQFRHFLDQIPIAIVVSEIGESEQIVYANPEFEKFSGQSAAEVEGKPWTTLRGISDDGEDGAKRPLSESNDFVGTFQLQPSDDQQVFADVYSNVIEDDSGRPAYRLVALVDVTAHKQEKQEEAEQRLREKDTLLREIQHRVKNNLQMITALIRIEARNVPDEPPTVRFDRLAGRVEALQLLYRVMSEDEHGGEVDLGVYLSQIASAVMSSHAIEGIRLDLKVDTYPVSVNVAMPAGLVVNELLTNALKHAFVGRDRGTVVLHSLSTGAGCSVVIADDGIGLPDGIHWPKPGKLGALIARSLRENAKASFTVESSPGKGTSITIVFARADAAP